MDHHATILEAGGQEGVVERRKQQQQQLVDPKDDAFPFEVTSSSTTTGKRQAQRKAASPEDDDEEAVAVEEKVALLRRLVPGGEGMEVDGLLEETADYIAALKAQVGVMRALACLLSGPGLVDALPAEKGAGGLLTPEKPH